VRLCHGALQQAARFQLAPQHQRASHSKLDYVDFCPNAASWNPADRGDGHYLSQVRVTHDNIVVVCVNRHPTRPWQARLGQAGGWFNFNAAQNGASVQWVGQTNSTSCLLPPTNGWVMFSPKTP
jgi:1,4-alpha-glucan branching enzyme